MVLYLCVVLRTGQERQLVGCWEMCPDLLHLPKTLPFPPFRPSVLEPDLQRREKRQRVIKQAGRFYQGGNDVYPAEYPVLGRREIFKLRLWGWLTQEVSPPIWRKYCSLDKNQSFLSKMIPGGSARGLNIEAAISAAHQKCKLLLLQCSSTNTVSRGSGSGRAEGEVWSRIWVLINSKVFMWDLKRSINRPWTPLTFAYPLSDESGTLLTAEVVCNHLWHFSAGPVFIESVIVFD